jgi:protease-4
VELDSAAKLSLISYHKYKKSASTSTNTSSNKIAILVAEGEIRMGRNEDGVVGASTFISELKKLREDSKVKAIVLRVNSPGGSAVASKLMEREIQLTREVKPVVASMSDLAASGGYWISMGCDKIVAQPNTITGSIGVIGLIFNVQEFLKNKLGISIDKVKTGDFADIGDGLHSMTEEERAIIQDGVNEIYEEFTGKVASYRNLNIDTVLNMAGGRVWTGNQALAKGLVDDLGGLQKAIEIAAQMAELADYSTRYYPPKEDFFKQIFDGNSKEEFVSYLMGEPNEFQKLFQTLERIKKSEGILARIPYGIEFKY